MPLTLSFCMVNIFWIADAEAPTIACSGDESVNAQEGQYSTVVVWEDPAVTDNSGDVLPVSCDPKSGTNFTIGQTTVICEAVDESGNRAECSFTVNVTGSCLTLRVYVNFPILKRVVPILTCVFSTLNWLTLAPKTHFIQFYLKVTFYFLSWGRNKYMTLGMRLSWKNI